MFRRPSAQDTSKNPSAWHDSSSAPRAALIHSANHSRYGILVRGHGHCGDHQRFLAPAVCSPFPFTVAPELIHCPRRMKFSKPGSPWAGASAHVTMLGCTSVYWMYLGGWRRGRGNYISPLPIVAMVLRMKTPSSQLWRLIIACAAAPAGFATNLQCASLGVHLLLPFVDIGFRECTSSFFTSSQSTDHQL